MRNLFFYGTLRHAPLLNLVLGREIELIPARLSDWRVVWAAGESFPMLIRSPGAVAEGILAEGLSDEDVARLDYYEGAFSYDLVAIELETAKGVAEAKVYLPQDAPWQPGEDWQLEDWVATWGDLTLLAAEEVMQGYGQESAAEVAARFGIIRARAQSRLRAAEPRAGRFGIGWGRDAVEIERHDRLQRGFINAEHYQHRIRRFDGSVSASQSRDFMVVADAVTVLPFDPVRRKVLLVEQFRVGAYALGDARPWLLEPVAGIADAGESFETTARRECLEEAGLELSALHHVSTYYPSPGGLAQRLISYIGIADLHDDLPLSGGLEHEGEDIRSLIVSLEDLAEMLTNGEASNAPLVISAQALLADPGRFAKP